ncbi:MAG: hypothetical protein ACYDGN_05275 [Acidimicrobiales bacterium]
MPRNRASSTCHSGITRITIVASRNAPSPSALACALAESLARALGGPHRIVTDGNFVIFVCRSDTKSLVESRTALLALSRQGLDPHVVVATDADDPPEELADTLGHCVAGVVTPSLSPPEVDRLASVVLGEIGPLAQPRARITELAPSRVVAAAMELGGARGTSCQ